jgi:hypothetical protein
VDGDLEATTITVEENFEVNFRWRIRGEKSDIIIGWRYGSIQVLVEAC